jgi:aldehyde dehydrogenase (NAD+)
MTTTDRAAAPSRYDRFDLMPIAGEWRAGSADDEREDHDPYTGEVLTTLRQADASDVDTAYEAAERAARDWAAALPVERAEVMANAADVLGRRQQEVIEWLVAEAGSTQVKAESEWAATVADFLEAASMPNRVEGRIMPSSIPGQESRVYRQPVGVVAVISPWNWPLHLSNRSVAPALACGNAVVLKPAGDTPVCGGLLLAEVLAEAGLPEAVLSVLIGGGGRIGDALVQHPVPQVVSFTGSTVVGRGIAEKAALKRLSLELGGNGPFVVLDDADLAAAVDAAVFGKFLHQGQICIAINRIVVDSSVHDEFVDRFVERVRALPVGDPREPETVIGPIINQSQLDSVRDKVREAVEQGAKVVLGGEPSGPTGLVLPPHVLLAGNDVATARQEVFGPVATVIAADGEEEALAIANDTELGLSSAVFSGDLERGVRFARRVRAGMTHVNDQPINDQANTAFGGEKESGLGRFGGDWAIEEFTTDHWVSVQHGRREFPF